MAATLTADPALNRYDLGSGESAMIFQYVDITDSIEQAYDTFAGGGGTLTVTLHSEDGPVGTLIDPSRSSRSVIRSSPPATTGARSRCPRKPMCAPRPHPRPT